MERLIQGEMDEYYWFVTDDVLLELEALVIRFHQHLHLAIIAFDSGPVSPTEEELDLGWRGEEGMMISPPVTDRLQIPMAGYDEWAIVRNSSMTTVEFTPFVNSGGFTVEPVGRIYERFDPTWEKGTLDFLPEMQMRFWEQVRKFQAVSYFCLNDRSLVVSRDKEFINAVIATVK